MKRHYQRSEILSYLELNKEQQAIANDLYDNCHNYQFVLWDNEPICLSEFLTIKHPVYHGQHTLTAFSCYFIRTNRDQTQATVIYAHC